MFWSDETIAERFGIHVTFQQNVVSLQEASGCRSACCPWSSLESCWVYTLVVSNVWWCDESPAGGGAAVVGQAVYFHKMAVSANSRLMSVLLTRARMFDPGALGRTKMAHAAKNLEFGHSLQLLKSWSGLPVLNFAVTVVCTAKL